MGVAGLFEELLKDVPEVATSLLGFGVGDVGLQDEHFDRFAAHDGFFYWDGGADEVSFREMDVRLLGESSDGSSFVDVGKARSD